MLTSEHLMTLGRSGSLVVAYKLASCTNRSIMACVQGKVYLALQVPVTACPCALVLSTPVVVVAGLTAAAKMGYSSREDIYWSLKVVTFDKTGILTQGRFQVMHPGMLCSVSSMSSSASPATATSCICHMFCIQHTCLDSLHIAVTHMLGRHDLM